MKISFREKFSGRNFVALVLAAGFVLSMSVAFAPPSAHGQTQQAADSAELERRLKKMEGELRRVERSSEDAQRAQRVEIDSLKARVEALATEADKKVDSLSGRFDAEKGQLKGEIAGLGGRVEDVFRMTSTYVVIAAIGLSVLVGLSVWFFRRKSHHTHTHFEETRKSLEERWVQTDTKLVELLEREVKVSSEALEEATTAPLGPSGEKDHSLQLKVADEIVRIQNYLSFLDPKAKGVKHLAAAVTRLEDNLAAEGYEIPKLLNKPYDPGMKVIANFKVDEGLRPDEQIITRIIKPAVNFNGVMIQAAEIEVSQGE